jgi:NAD(P)-dependent dehydrogenase (short-subunit alcohol dehydrogenase family)
MRTKRKQSQGIGLALAVTLLAANATYAVAGVRESGAAVELAQAGGTEPRELEPRYQPVQPEEPSWYNSSYIFGMTRSVAASTMVPAAKVPLFVLTVPLDIVFLPFAAIGGLFG